MRLAADAELRRLQNVKQANHSHGQLIGPEMVQFFKTGKAPVSAEETTDIFAFMEAADESKRQGGAPVTLESVLKKARAENAKRAVQR